MPEVVFAHLHGLRRRDGFRRRPEPMLALWVAVVERTCPSMNRGRSRDENPRGGADALTATFHRVASGTSGDVA